ncbi:MAG: type IV secretion system DNA-binding domain-containing protein [Oceanicaulis sp.]|uniref:type IV secretion system DNA-binding domain-containing protein n=1 Tax=Glycocaulis sp. TaxID=1969725 RepID=UPI0025BB4491|nr:type IV secretion system DNA-binding domain-containing protein [Glycocaulis sp.]MCC5982683.1 type IV secretion system DNA-binding domain-containing protein [Oceanicaulis sp.]MCH8522836.1 type IV secretory system conjugative DNA transfer family protein [Glycocaulis sp.]
MTELLPAILGGLSWLILAAVLLVPFTRRFIVRLLNIIPAVTLFVVGLAALPLWKPIHWLISRAGFFSEMVKYLSLDAERLGTRKQGLASGDRLAFAKEAWPEDRFAVLYSDELPEDIRRPLWEDGKLIGGYSLTWMADRHFSEGLTQAAARFGLTAGLIALVVQVLAVALVALAGTQDTSATRVLHEAFPGEEPVYVSDWAVWHVVLAETAASSAIGLIGLVVVVISSLLVAVGVGMLVTLAMVEHWRVEAAAPYEILSKDAHVRWPHRAEARALAHTGYLRQFHHATGYLKGSPLFKVGDATGTMRVRGDLAAPMAGQSISLDWESLFQHLMVFGGTGDGKTTAILKPLMAQVLAEPQFGAYVTDAKGVLWRDAEQIAESLGRSADIVKIGTAPGELGVNITGKLDPNQISGVMRSVLTQIGGGRSDSFWPDMAANVMRHVLTIGRAYAATPEGKKEAKYLNPYSLWWAYQAVLDEKRLNEAITVVTREISAHHDRVGKAAKALDREAFEKADESARIIYSTDVLASRSYLTTAWTEMAERTKSGIVANISQLMDGFAGAEVLRQRFISGLDDRTASLDAPLHGKIALVTLNTMDDGLPARLVAVLLKTVLYREARLREAAFKRSGENPQDKPCLVMMDEVQELATVDPASGLSDATFWNVARSTGLAGVFATQTMAALVQSMGKAAADNFIQQARSKVFLRSEDEATVSYACWLAGEFERNRVFGDGQWESLDQRKLVSGWSPFEPIDDAAPPAVTGGPWGFFQVARGYLGRTAIGAASARPAYPVDDRFIPEADSHGSQLSARQQAAWRQEDKDRSYRTEGNALAPALTPADFIAMGRFHAYAHIQRAGLARGDVMTLDPMF